MADGAVKTPNKRKGAQGKPNGAAKKIKVDNKQINNKVKKEIVKKETGSPAVKKIKKEAASPVKTELKPFKGTRGQTKESEKKVKKVKQENEAKGGGGGKGRKRKPMLRSLLDKIEKSDAEEKKTIIANLEEKKKSIESKSDLSKSLKRKLRIITRVLAKATGKSHVVVKPEKNGKIVKKEKAAKVNVKKVEKDDDEDENEEDSDEEEEDADEEEDAEEEEESDEEGAEDEEDEEESDEEVVEEAKPPQKKKPQTIGKTNRYVLFVGNIPYDTTKQDLHSHFEKGGNIKHIRIPTEKKTNKPRGFAYVELQDEESYQKCLSMHHTFLKGRRLNVLYTAGGKKQSEEKKKVVKVKNMKLSALRKQGQLLGSKKENQKRPFRRKKKLQDNQNGDE